MAKKKGVRVTIVVEDERLERFSRNVLLEFGFNRHELRVVPYPVGRGSAKDWVEKQYPTEVRVLRSKAYQKLALLVGTDADERSVAERLSSLAHALQDQDLPARMDDERIVIWVPKWNIETWMLYFLGDPRDEDHDYKHDVKKPDFAVLAKAFATEYRQFNDDDSMDTLPSLRVAYGETERLGV